MTNELSRADNLLLKFCLFYLKRLFLHYSYEFIQNYIFSSYTALI